MPVMKIPDLLLQKLRCPCGRYLSKAPINIRDGQSVCKDCIDTLAPSLPLVARNTPYEALASQFVFPCRYELQGCPKHIKFDEVANHETVCAYRTHNCPANLHSSCNWKGAISQLQQHYESEHRGLCLQRPCFEISVDKDFEVYKLIRINDTLLLLQIKCQVGADKLWFNMVCFRNTDDAALITYTVELKISGTSRLIRLDNAHAMPITSMQMVPGESLDVDLSAAAKVLRNSTFIECHWIIDITQEMLQQQQELEEREILDVKNENIKCPNCGIYMVPPIYCCNQDHFTCIECKGYYSECKTCQKRNVEFTRAVDLEEVAKSGQHSCRWARCRQVFSYEEIRQHEQTCAGRIYKCPVCSIWAGLHDEVVDHFKSVHPEHTIQTNDVVSIAAGRNTSVLGYVLAHREVFKFHVTYLNWNVWYLGAPNYADCWEYKITGGYGNASALLQKVNFNLYAGKLQITESIFGEPLHHRKKFGSTRWCESVSLFDTPSLSSKSYNLHITKIK